MKNLNQDWPHQIKIVEQIEAARAQGIKKLCVQLATGGGKSRIIRRATEIHYNNKKIIYLIAHRRNLVNQLSAEIWEEAGIQHGIILPNMPQIRYRVQVCSIQTLISRAKNLPYPYMIIIDEAHHIKASTYMKLLKLWPEALLLGLTATPRRTNGEPLNDVFQQLIVGPPPAFLIENGFLCDFKYLEPFTVDASDVDIEHGDYVSGQLVKKMDKPAIIGDVITEYKKHADHTPAIASCVNINHAEHVANMFCDAGYKAVALHSELDNNFIEANLRAFKNNKIDLISQVDLLGEGTNIPGAVTLLQLRHTQSLIIFLQHAGRVLRGQEGKTAIILDFVGNRERHGFPDEDREWSLEGLMKRDKGKLIYKQCPECYAQNVPKKDKICPHCFFEFPTIKRPGAGRTRDIPENIPGHLVDIRNQKKYMQIPLDIYSQSSNNNNN